jgi:glycosyltransferase involved in cell wall biosynthesis
VGNAYPHKNLEKLIEVFSKMEKLGEENKTNTVSLVLVGKEDYFFSRLKVLAANLNIKNIVFPGYVPDCDLRALYQEAEAYVFPSLFEGFGLPPLEAMVHGCPVVSSDKTCLPEILGEAALYFNPEDEGDMIAKIKTILTDEKLRTELIKRGYEQMRKYSWEKCAKETLEILNNN